MAFTPRIEINGKIDTGQNVLANMNKIAAACQSFITWDPSIGSWKTILNRQGSSVMTFDDSNIVGSITVSGAGINDQYNSVRVEYSNKDSNGSKDERTLTIPTADRFDRELDNQLNLSFDFVTDPVQAELLGAIELKQSRADTIIEFTTDFRALGLRAGEIIGINNEYYFEGSSANPRLFRVITIEETDGDDGGILLAITGIEYLSTVYNTDGLTREERIIDTGFTPKSENICVIEKENIATGKRVGEALQTPEGRSAITSAGVPIFETLTHTWSTSEVQLIFGPGTGLNAANQLEIQLQAFELGNNLYDHSMVNGVNFIGYQLTVASTGKLMEIDFEGPQGQMSYTINGRNGSINAGIPTQIFLFYSDSPTGPWLKIDDAYLEWSTYSSRFAVADIDVPISHWLIMAGSLVTYDLSETSNNIVEISSVSNVSPRADGSAADLSFKFFLN